MSLSNDLISQFAKITNDNEQTKSGSTVYGTIVEYNGSKYVKLDGSDLLTPISSTTNVEPDERVTVDIKNHTATVTGNLSSPSARTTEVETIGSKISDFEIVIADKVDTIELNAQIARIDSLTADNVTIKETLTANKADITELQADNVTIKDELTANKADITELEAENATITGKLEAADADIKSLQSDNVIIRNELTAANADIDNLEADYGEFKNLNAENLEAIHADIEEIEAKKLSVIDAEATFATIDNLDAINADVVNLEADYAQFKYANATNLNAINADIANLEATKLSATDADLKYANIDFSNIGKAAIEHFYATSGLIKDVVVGDGTITGELVGVTIKGDLIEGNTIKAEKLVIKGEDGLYYKLNTNGVTTEAEQTDQNSLNGSVIMAKSITATKIAVDDLVAFDATIGGFNITDSAIYSGVKESATNTTRGIYLDKEGQFSVGDSDNFLRYYRDQNGNYKLEISASSVTMTSSGKTIENELSDIKDEMTVIKDEVTTLLRIESSRGTVFKNDQVSTVLSAVIYRGHQRITDMATLKTVVGASAYLEWSWQRLNDESYGVISADDSRIGNEGFTFTLSPDDVDTKVTFMCTLNI